MKKLLIFIISLALVLPVFSGCGNKVTSDTLVVWQAGLNPEYKAVLAGDEGNPTALFTKLIVDKFEADNPGKKVMLKSAGWGQELNQSITNAIISKEEVDLVPGEVYINKLIEGEFFTEIKGNYKETVVPFLYDRFNSDKTYAVPAYTSSFALFVNKGTLRKAKIIDANDAVLAPYKERYATRGIDPLAPKTFEGMLEVCKDIQAEFIGSDGKTNGMTGGTIINDVPKTDDSAWRALPFMRMAGGDYADYTGAATLNSEANLKAFTMMSELNKTAPRNSTAKENTNYIIDYFFENQIAYLVEGASVITLLTPAKKAYGDVVVTEVPQFDGVDIKSNASVGTVYYSIPAHSKKKELATAFIDTLLSDEVQKAAVKLDSRVPATKKILESEEIKTAEYNYEFLAPFFAPYSDPEYINVKPLYAFNKNPSLIWDAWRSFVGKIFTQKGDVKTNLDITQSEFTKYINRD